jgi:chromosome segregation ATPase
MERVERVRLELDGLDGELRRTYDELNALRSTHEQTKADLATACWERDEARLNNGAKRDGDYHNRHPDSAVTWGVWKFGELKFVRLEAAEEWRAEVEQTKATLASRDESIRALEAELAEAKARISELESLCEGLRGSEEAWQTTATELSGELAAQAGAGREKRKIRWEDLPKSGGVPDSPGHLSSDVPFPIIRLDDDTELVSVSAARHWLAFAANETARADAAEAKVKSLSESCERTFATIGEMRRERDVEKTRADKATEELAQANRNLVLAAKQWTALDEAESEVTRLTAEVEQLRGLLQSDRSEVERLTAKLASVRPKRLKDLPTHAVLMLGPSSPWIIHDIGGDRVVRAACAEFAIRDRDEAKAELERLTAELTAERAAGCKAEGAYREAKAEGERLTGEMANLFSDLQTLRGPDGPVQQLAVCEARWRGEAEHQLGRANAAEEECDRLCTERDDASKSRDAVGNELLTTKGELNRLKERETHRASVEHCNAELIYETRKALNANKAEVERLTADLAEAKDCADMAYRGHERQIRDLKAECTRLRAELAACSAGPVIDDLCRKLDHWLLKLKEPRPNGEHVWYWGYGGEVHDAARSLMAALRTPQADSGLTELGLDEPKRSPPAEATPERNYLMGSHDPSWPADFSGPVTEQECEAADCKCHERASPPKSTEPVELPARSELFNRLDPDCSYETEDDFVHDLLDQCDALRTILGEGLPVVVSRTYLLDNLQRKQIPAAPPAPPPKLEVGPAEYHHQHWRKMESSLNHLARRQRNTEQTVNALVERWSQVSPQIIDLAMTNLDNRIRELQNQVIALVEAKETR